MNRWPARVLIVLSLLVSLPASADWTDTISYDSSNSSSLKVVGTENLNVSVKINGETKSDTTPTIFNFDNVAAFIKVTVTAPNGDVWSNKVEIKQYQQTVLNINWVEGKPIEQHDGTQYIGMARNITDKCSNEYLANVRFDMLLDGKTIKEITLQPGQVDRNIEVPAGNYKVRIYLHQTGDEWIFSETIDFSVTNDGWDLWYGCK